MADTQPQRADTVCTLCGDRFAMNGPLHFCPQAPRPADTVRFRVSATLEFEASVTDERAFEIAKSELERHLWTWRPRVDRVTRIDGSDA